jgi:hypothetical protein
MGAERLLYFTGALAAVAIALQAMEHLISMWRGGFDRPVPLEALSRILAKESILPERFFSIFFSNPVFATVQILRILLGCGLLFFGVSPFVAQGSLVLQGYTTLRFGGAFNGGSDAMTGVVLIGLVLGAIKPEWGLLSIGVQSGLSYFMSGIRKALNQDWWTGKAILGFVNASPVGMGAPTRFLPSLRSSLFLAPLSWVALGFQIGFPLLIRSHWGLIVALGLGVAFHFGNVLIFGLNRFFWIWIATYPSVVYLAKKWVE